jgi:hypothetical protein
MSECEIPTERANKGDSRAAGTQDIANGAIGNDTNPAESEQDCGIHFTDAGSPAPGGIHILEDGDAGGGHGRDKGSNGTDDRIP